ncbi:hypothetical protein RF11_11930 [Thelohanellus kitauei]|uniref:Tc1-like transposase DDE domain-containing protein n=1 Tax=Thelohanellus kitauei TaxID=669202 RepID=A0A0C2MP44_THEKT|nr:hypothetical protein RF11_11930 [Thelohanellus kitauei]
MNPQSYSWTKLDSISPWDQYTAHRFEIQKKIVKSIRSKNISISNDTLRITHRVYDRETYGPILSELFSEFADMNFTHCAFIMDNVPFHKCEIIQNTITAFGHSVM